MSEKMSEAALRRAAAMWIFVVQRQADRLHEAIGDLHAAHADQVFLDQRDAGTLPEAWEAYVENEVGDGMSWQVAWTAGAEQYFFLLAAAQLRKCVLRLPNDGLPAVPDSKMIRLLRNFTEHWENPMGPSAIEIRELVPDATPGRAWSNKHDVWFEGVSMYGIVSWAQDVERGLRANATRTGEVLPAPNTPLPGV